MLKKFFLLPMLTFTFCCIFAENVQIKTNGNQDNAKECKIKFTLVKTPEFTKFTELLSPQSKLSLDVFIDKVRGLIFDNPELLEIIEKYKNLYSQFKSRFNREPDVTFILSVDIETEFDISKDTEDIEKFKNKLSLEELKQFNTAMSEFRNLMFSKVDSIFTYLESSGLNKELKEISGNEFTMSCIIS